MTAPADIDARVWGMFQVVLAVPRVDVQQRALSAALSVADCKSRLHIAIEIRDKFSSSDDDGPWPMLNRIVQEELDGLNEALVAARGALG